MLFTGNTDIYHPKAIISKRINKVESNLLNIYDSEILPDCYVETVVLKPPLIR